MTTILICLVRITAAQYFQFSQYNFTPQRINPAQVGDSDYASLSLDYRNQATDGGFHLTSNVLNVAYPLISRTGQRWSGIGLTFMDDRSGQAGIFNTQEAGLSYALNVPLARYETISLGVKGLYQSRKIDLDGLYTGAQYVPDRGFNEALSSGENSGQFKTDFITFSAGLHWQRSDKEGTRLGYAGISFFDFNKPENSFFELESQLNSTFVASFGLRAYQRRALSIFPELLYTRSASANVLNVGWITRYDLKTDSKPLTYINIITKYVVGRSGILGLQLYKENFTVGISYDFPVFVRNVANTGALEVGIALRKLVVRDKKISKKTKQSARMQAQQKQAKPKLPVREKSGEKNQVEINPKLNSDTAMVTTHAKEDLSSRLKSKQDSVATSTAVGKLHHEALILERATLNFNFEFNSANVNEKTAIYLDDLAKALNDNPELKLHLEGHTDNVGSQKFNLKLSHYRAQTMKDYLVKRGVDPSRISIAGKGMSDPLNDNGTEAKRALNRRVELTIQYEN